MLLERRTPVAAFWRKLDHLQNIVDFYFNFEGFHFKDEYYYFNVETLRISTLKQPTYFSLRQPLGAS